MFVELSMWKQCDDIQAQKGRLVAGTEQKSEWWVPVLTSSGRAKPEIVEQIASRRRSGSRNVVLDTCHGPHAECNVTSIHANAPATGYTVTP